MREKQQAKKTRLLFVSTDLTGGGAERVIACLLREIDRDRFEPGLALFIKEIDYAIPRDLPVFILDKRHWFDYPLLVWRLSRIYRTWKPDVTLSFLHYPNNIAVLARMVSGSKTKIVLSEHGMPSFLLLQQKGPVTRLFLKWLPRFLYPKADQIICVSRSLAEQIQVLFSLPPQKIKVIYNPIDIQAVLSLAGQNVEHPWFIEDIPVIINISSLIPTKGHEYLLRAFKRVLSECPCRLMLLGKGDMEESLKQMALRLGIQNEVSFLGFQNNPFKYLSRATVFALSSISEVFPMVILEAMCCGLPVIATAYPGSSEIITSGVNGLVVPPADEQALAKAIVELLKDKKYAHDLARAGREKIGDYDAKKVIKAYESCLGSIQDENITA